MNDDPTHDEVSDYDTVTAADIAAFAHQLAELRFGQLRAGDPAERALFLAHKADLLIRIAAQHTRTDPGYAEHILQLAHAAHAAAAHAALQLPQQRVGPTSTRTPTPQPAPSGASSRENSGASSG
jgi:hypothetical protein